MHGLESNTTDMKVKNQRKETGEKGEENASLSRNVDSSLYLQYLSLFSLNIYHQRFMHGVL